MILVNVELHYEYLIRNMINFQFYDLTHTELNLYNQQTKIEKTNFFNHALHHLRA
jgi:hypothetical protein